MRDHDPRNATYESNHTATGAEAAYESVRDLPISEEAPWSRPSLGRASLGSLDVHDRPTFVP